MPDQSYSFLFILLFIFRNIFCSCYGGYRKEPKMRKEWIFYGKLFPISSMERFTRVDASNVEKILEKVRTDEYIQTVRFEIPHGAEIIDVTLIQEFFVTPMAKSEVIDRFIGWEEELSYQLIGY